MNFIVRGLILREALDRLRVRLNMCLACYYCFRRTILTFEVNLYFIEGLHVEAFIGQRTVMSD